MNVGRTRLLLILAVVAATACGGAETVPTQATATPQASPTGVGVDVTIPRLSLPGMHHADAILDAESAAFDAVHPGDAQAALATAGFVGAAQSTYTGARGRFSRVVVRQAVFESPEGATGFLDWLATHTVEWIGEASSLTDPALPGSVTMWLHEPSGCCHEEVPIYLAMWQRGNVVWTIRASGPKIQTQRVIDLVTTFEQEV